LVFTQYAKTRADRGEPSIDLALRELRTEKRARHPIDGRSAAWLAPELMVDCERSANRAAGITGRRLNPDPVKLAVAQYLAVGDAIERHAPRKTEIAGSGVCPIRCKAFVNLFPVFFAAADNDKDWYEHLYILGDDHFSAAGNRMMFEELEKRLLP
jgi:hypothetical protein